MTYYAKTEAERAFRWSVKFARAGKRRRKNWKRWYYCDWEDAMDCRQRILRRIHAREMREVE